jgi:hypothetical protein
LFKYEIFWNSKIVQDIKNLLKIENCSNFKNVQIQKLFIYKELLNFRK